jgi:hypothetical protein
MTNSAAASPVVSSKANTPQLMHDSSNKSRPNGGRNSAPYASGSDMNQNDTRSSSRVATAVGTGAATPVIPSGNSSRKPSASAANRETNQ